MGADSRTTTGGGGRLRSLLVIGEVATAVLLLFGAGLLLRTLMAVESFDRGYRAESVLTMLVDPLGVELSDAREAAAVLRSGRSGSADGARRAGRGLVERAAARRLALWRLRADLRDRRRSAGAGGAAADHQLSGRQPDVLLDARSADRRRPRLRRARHARQPARLHRQRSVRRARSAAASPIGMRVVVHGRRLAAGQAERRRDRRRREAGQGPAGRAEGLRADLRADGARSVRRHRF